MNYKMIRYIIGMILVAESAFMVLPMIVSVIYGEFDIIMPFVYSIITTFVAATLFGLKKPKIDLVFAKESYIAVAAGWILVSLFGAMPFYLSGAIPSVADAIFETVSGFTTTGATILTAVEHLPKGILFWRTFTHWIGGMGIIVFLMMLTQISEGHSLYIMRAEVPGPSVGKITPKSSSNALILYGIYTALTVVEFVFLLFGGMPVFDAITTAMSTAGTGGFSVRDAGIGAYDSAYIEWVVAIFMLIFSINFNLYFLILIKKLKIAIRSEELKVFLTIIAVSTLAIGISCFDYYGDFGTSIRKAFFQTTAIISTSGFGGIEYMDWPMLCHSVLLILMFIGGCAGSTAGGIKLSRIIMTFKMLRKESHRLAHPHGVTTIKFEGKFVDKETRSFIMVYMSAFFVILAISSIIIMITGHDYETAFTATLTCLNNVGPALGEIGHSGLFAMFSGIEKIFFSLLMLTGRLEIFPILILFMPTTWRKH
ncbi:MAG: TrkH family potassium uptake protein [Oscillospiraceae bacterium]|nr:TrkH family potassium uptake protein [Oscillospiraceae bacterium]